MKKQVPRCARDDDKFRTSPAWARAGVPSRIHSRLLVSADAFAPANIIEVSAACSAHDPIDSPPPRQGQAPLLVGLHRQSIAPPAAVRFTIEDRRRAAGAHRQSLR